jgi:hypothetical protein
MRLVFSALLTPIPESRFLPALNKLHRAVVYCCAEKRIIILLKIRDIETATLSEFFNELLCG